MKVDVEELLRERFGFAGFRPGQGEVIGHLMAGRSALAVFPTGAGKSLCYQLPALLLGGMTLVISPLIALMKDQIDFLLSKGVAAARLDSSLSGEEARRVWDDLREGRLKLLYVAPERFGSERFLQRLRRLRIDLMVIDEAHCISEWGHNFRPDYLKLSSLVDELAVSRVLALTATATAAVAGDICRGFHIVPEAYVNTGFYRSNLTLRATPVAVGERDALVLRRIHGRPRGATVVYVTLQRTAERVAAFLAASGLGARAYHAGLADEERHAVQDWFMGSPDAVVVATIAFGMGIDKADIRYVYHYNLPKSLENYMQETGRAGRDGEPACCDLLVCSDDVITLQNFTYGDTPDDQAISGLVVHLLGQADTFDVSVYALSARFDIRNLVVSTLLTYLELDGVIASTGPFYNEYRFQPHRPSAEILADLDVEQAAFLKGLLSRAVKGRTWFSLDMAAAAEALRETRERLVVAMNQLEDRGDLTLKVAGIRRGYRYLERPTESSALIQVLRERFSRAEARDIARISQVVELGEARACLVRGVLAYFGEDLGRDCGHCDRCLQEPIASGPPACSPAPRGVDREVIRALVEEGHEALGSPRRLARFLCGLTSPATLRAKLTRDPRFGRMGQIPFQAVLAVAEREVRGLSS